MMQRMLSMLAVAALAPQVVAQTGPTVRCSAPRASELRADASVTGATGVCHGGIDVRYRGPHDLSGRGQFWHQRVGCLCVDLAFAAHA